MFYSQMWQIETDIQVLDIAHIFGDHSGRHLEFLKKLNDARVASFSFLKSKVLATRISQEKSLNPISGS